MQSEGFESLSKSLVVKIGSPRLEASPEMSFLLSLAVLQARRSFDGANLQSITSAGELEAIHAPAGPVLLLGSEDVFVGEASLRAMGRELENGADVAIPTVATAYPEVADNPVYGLRDFELFEARCLGDLSQPETTATALPVSLWSPEAWQKAHGQHLEGLSVARAGIYYGFVDYYGELRDDIQPYIPSGVREVLEVGCGTGRTGAWMQETFDCRVTGVELHPGAARIASERLSEVREGNVLDVDLGGPYDLIVGLELYEHLPEPGPVVEKFRQALAPGGRILLSVPNVGHYSVVADLVKGRWDYVPMGHLCYTHYRFYTRRTLEDWIERWGFRNYQLVAQETPIAEFARPLLDLPGADPVSLATKGFYVLIDLD